MEEVEDEIFFSIIHLKAIYIYIYISVASYICEHLSVFTYIWLGAYDIKSWL